LAEKQKSIEALEEELNRLIGEYNRLVKSLEYFPTVRTIALIKKMAELIRILKLIPKDVWKALFRFVKCDDEGLADLTVEKLKQLVELLKAIAELELEAEEDEKRKKELQGWIKELKRTLDSWAETWLQKQALAAVKALKQFLKDHYPEILAALLSYFGDDIKEEFEQWLEKSTPRFLKKIIKKIIEKILIKKLGKEAAKKFIPFVGIALTLAELIALGYVLRKIDDLRELIDELLAELIRRLAKVWTSWPSQHEYVWFQGEKYEGAKITIRPFVRCAERVSGNLKWGKEYQVKFSDGSKEKRATLNQNSPYYDKEKKKWIIPFTIDKASVDAYPCVKTAIMCYIYLEVTITFSTGETMTHHFIVGVKVFKK